MKVCQRAKILCNNILVLPLYRPFFFEASFFLWCRIFPKLICINYRYIFSLLLHRYRIPNEVFRWYWYSGVQYPLLWKKRIFWERLLKMRYYLSSLFGNSSALFRQFFFPLLSFQLFFFIFLSPQVFFLFFLYLV